MKQTLGVLFLLAGFLNSVGAADAASCMQERGRKKAHELVAQCLQVSPATHPPCNALNSCSLIEDEIKRSCKLLGSDKPHFCNAY